MIRKLGLRALIGSIALSALTGIYVLVFGGDSEIEGKVFVTALSISGLSILVMACGVALERGKLGFVPHAGTATAVARFILLMILILDHLKSVPLPFVDRICQQGLPGFDPRHLESLGTIS